jgi:hypothetical protein
MTSVAFGQKGRWQMKLFEIPMFVASLLGFGLLSGLDAPPAYADFTFGEPEKVSGLRYNEWIDCISYDGLEMYTEGPGGPAGDQYYWDLWVHKRASKDEDWGPPENLGPLINSVDYEECGASISSDGLTLYFVSWSRPDGYGGADIYTTTRATRNDPWGPAVNLGPAINSSDYDQTVCISADDLELYFGSKRSDAYGDGTYDIYVARRVTPNDPWGAAVNLGPQVNTPYGECYVSLSPDGLLLLFSEWNTSTINARPGGYGNADLWMTRRASIDAPWQTPVNLGPLINGPTRDFFPRISSEGHTLYFRSIDREGRGNFQVPIILILDFNGDGKVDIADVAIMLEHWHTDYSLCDIGPFPWGDGFVDAQDLIVLAQHLFEGSRPAAHWKLDEEQGSAACDSAGPYDAELHGGPLWQPAGGKEGGALQFDGVDDYVSTPFILDPAKGSFSVFAWVKSSGRGQVIVSQNDATGTRWLWTDPSYGRLTTWLMHPPFDPLMSGSTVTDGQWHHVGLVFDFEALRRYLYVDGREAAKDTVFVGGVGSNGGLYFGAEKTLGAGTFFSGLIDDVRIYNVALSAEEVAALAR